MDLEQLKYPIGKPQFKDDYSSEDLQAWKDNISSFAKKMIEETKGMSDEALAWKYRPDGWNIRQLVHHCADSHMNAFNRLKRSLTEGRAEVMPYQEAAYAELPDVVDMPIDASLLMLHGIHARWSKMMEHLSEKDLQKGYFRVGDKSDYKVIKALQLYSWHGEHHLAHVRMAKKSQNEFA